MYHSHFGLNQSPFSITPNPAFFYSGSQRGDILEALIYAVSHGEGIIKVTGEVGSGKTMLCRMLEGMMPSHVEVIYLVNPTLSREEVMFTIAGELEIPTEGKRPDEVIRLLHQDLIGKHINGKQVVLLVEEAQAMSLETLEEIRLFSNLETAHHKLLQIVLFGQPELDDNLNLPSMRQLKERITHSFMVPPMTASLIPEFLMFRMRAAGYHGPNVFSKSAIRLLAKVSEGIVRRINILADKALLAAFADNTHAVEAKHVKAAIRDSEFSSSKLEFSYRYVAIVLFALMLCGGLLYWAFWTWQATHTTLPPSTAHAASAPTVSAAPPPQSLNLGSTLSPTLSPTGNSATSIASNDARAPSPAVTHEKSQPEIAQISLLQQRVAQSKIWLRETPAQFYTLQLGLFAQQDANKIELQLKAYAAHFGIENLYLFPTKIDQQQRLGIVYSSFSQRQEAWLKRKNVEVSTSYKAQLRTIEGLRNEMQTTQSEDMW
jgi:type II secretory pathway predicted ATPase ExeA